MEHAAVIVPPSAAKPLRLAPFRALRLAPRRVGDPATLRQLSRGSRTVGLASWRERAHPVQDAVPAVYLHEYSAAGLTVRGLVGALDLTRRAHTAQERAVLPHEGIRPAQADDLADRMQELEINPAPILLVHRAAPAVRELVAETMRRRPQRTFTDRVGQRHRVWPITSETAWGRLDVALADAQALIADGHHRYAAYLRMQARGVAGDTDHGLAMLVDQEDTPLHLGAIHRCLVGVSLGELSVAVGAAGHRCEPTSRVEALARMGPDTLAATDGTGWASVVLRTAALVDRAAVEVLHQDVLPALPHGPQRVEYLHSAEQAFRAVRRVRRVALLMPAPDVDQVLRIAAAGRLLPEKATSFQPKPSAGVFIRSLTE